MFKVLHNKPFWVHILLAIAIIVLILFLFTLSLNWITKHGESNNVPAVVGKKLKDAEKTVESKGFELIIQDSVYVDSLPPGQIIKQFPEADEVVKVNRTVYVTINRFVAPDVEMPAISGYSYRNAEMVLKNLGLKIGDTSSRPDFAKNTVLEASYKGNIISAGTKIKMGSTVDLVLGRGVSNEFIPVPDLVGMTYEDARALLDAQGIIAGSVVPDADVRDTASAFVSKQIPAMRTLDGKRLSIRQGQMIDLFLSVNPPVTDSLKSRPLPIPNEY